MFSPNEKAAKEAALQKLMDLLDDEDAQDIKGKPMAAELSVTKLDPKDEGEDEEESHELPSDFAKAWAEMKGEPLPGHEDEEEAPEAASDDHDEESDISPEDIQRISELYHKHVAGRK